MGVGHKLCAKDVGQVASSNSCLQLASEGMCDAQMLIVGGGQNVLAGAIPADGVYTPQMHLQLPLQAHSLKKCFAVCKQRLLKLYHGILLPTTRKPTFGYRIDWYGQGSINRPLVEAGVKETLRGVHLWGANSCIDETMGKL